MRVLVYGNRKIDDVMYDASTPEKEAAAFLKVFKMLDEGWQVYSDLETIEELKVCEACEKGLHKFCPQAGERCNCMQQECVKRSTNRIRLYNARVKEKGLLEKARKGDAAAAKQLMNARRTYEYEAYSFKEVQNPL